MKEQRLANNIKERRTGNGSFKDRRLSRDFLSRVLAFFNLAAWVMMALILVLAERAKPQFESFFDRFYNLNIRRSWDIEFVHYLLWVTMIGVIVSSAGVALSLFRARRREDSSRFGLVIMGIFSVVCFCIIIFFYIGFS
ncbi:MAG: hypothetical protein RBR67_07715 [Desulfobacterium sp.]|jgi:hypothetical protein|nr:hypothetical protein [Desulfobacterium sp.]